MMDIEAIVKKYERLIPAGAYTLGEGIRAALTELAAAYEQQIEVERMRLAACGVIAMSNTAESAAKARQMLPEYWSASAKDCANAVDREMALQERIRQLSETHAIEMRAYEATVANQAERIRQLEAERVPDGWIPVSERLPDDGAAFLAVLDCAGDRQICTMRLPVLLEKHSVPCGDFIRERVTHWMPLPAAPQPKKEGG